MLPNFNSSHSKLITCTPLFSTPDMDYESRHSIPYGLFSSFGCYNGPSGPGFATTITSSSGINDVGVGLVAALPENPAQFLLPIRQEPPGTNIQSAENFKAAKLISKSRNKKRWQLSDTAWNAHKKTIRKLYIEDNNTLEQTITIMQENHQFSAS